MEAKQKLVVITGQKKFIKWLGASSGIGAAKQKKDIVWSRFHYKLAIVFAIKMCM